MVVVFGICQNNIAQKRIAVFATNNPSNSSSAKQIPEKIISYFSNDPDFKVVDRKNEHLINQELELQRDEKFMDGYVVEQEQAEGADYLCYSSYDNNSKSVSIQIIEVANNEVLCSSEREVKSTSFWGSKDYEQEIVIMLQEIALACFNKGFPVVRITKSSKNKAKQLLVLAGSGQKVKKGYLMEVTQEIEEEVMGKKIRRNIPIGRGFISYVEDENFCRLDLRQGKKEIYSALEDGIELKCKLISGKK